MLLLNFVGRTLFFAAYTIFVFAPLVHNFAHVGRPVYPEDYEPHLAGSSPTHDPDEPAGDPKHDHRAPCRDSCVFCQLFRSWNVYLTDPDQPTVLLGRESTVVLLTPEPPDTPEQRPPLIRGPPSLATI